MAKFSNFHHFNAKSKSSRVSVVELQYADDSVVITHAEEDEETGSSDPQPFSTVHAARKSRSRVGPLRTRRAGLDDETISGACVCEASDLENQEEVWPTGASRSPLKLSS